jgi:hypothetical protein
MPKACFLVRAVVAEPLREKFEHWYATDHLPRALKDFRAEKGWRYWSLAEPGVHYAFYQFADEAGLERIFVSPELKALVEDFNRNFPEVTRTWDKLALAEELDA